MCTQARNKSKLHVYNTEISLLSILGYLCLCRIKQHIDELEKEIQEGQAEGEELKKQFLHYKAEKAKIEAIRKKEKQELMGSHLQTVRDRDLIRDCEKQKEEEEEEEIRIFAAAKKKMTKLRKERERDLWQ